MTLLELLVKELPSRGGWPEGAVEFFVHTATVDRGYFYDINGWGVGVGGGIDTGSVKHVVTQCGSVTGCAVTREQYETAIASQESVWNGEGLPPVGSKVESFINGEWKLVKVVYTGEPGGKYEALVFDVKTIKPAWSDLFRPLRTEAERRREAAINEMASTPKPCGHAIYDICAQLYDAGYRKAGVTDDHMG